MGNCFSGPKKSQSRKITLAVFGLDNAGKTSVIKVLQGASQNEVLPTVGFSSNQLKWKKTPVIILDVGGGVRIRDIWKNYFAESHGSVYVVDASDRERIAEAKEVFSKVLTDPRMQGKPVLLLLNKQDVLGAINDTQAVEQMELEPLVNANKCPCRLEAVSATHGTGKNMDGALKEGFNWLIRYINDHYDELVETVNRDTEAQNAQLAKEKEERMERIRKAKEERKARGEDSEDEGETGKATDEHEPPRPISHPQNGQVQPSHEHITSERISETLSQPSPSVTNGHLPPLTNEFRNRSKRRVRPSSAGQESATLTSSFQMSVIPHLPPISPPQLKRPAPKLPTSDEIPPPPTPPPAASGTRPDGEVATSPLVADPMSPVMADASVMADDISPQRMPVGGTTRAVDQKARRKRRKKRLQRFNRTAPDIALEQLADGKDTSDQVQLPLPDPIVSLTRSETQMTKNLDPAISNASSLSAAVIEVPSRVKDSPPFEDSTPTVTL